MSAALPAMTHSAMAHPWLCDAQGHLNVRHHFALYDEATYFLLATVAADDAPLSRRTQGFADVHGEIDYLAEVPQGTVVCIHIGIERIGRTSLTIAAEMRGAASGRVFGRYRATTVHVNLKTGRARPLTGAMKQRAARFLIADDRAEADSDAGEGGRTARRVRSARRTVSRRRSARP